MHLSKLASAAALAALTVGASASHAATLLSESFNDVSTLAASGWVITNASASVGSTSWFQGNDGIFAALSGASNAYVAANFNAASSGAISLWLITPVLDFSTAGTLTFSTRTESPAAGYADSLQVFSSTGGTSTASFTNLLVSINPGQVADGYPTGWTSYTVSYDATGGSGRLAFVYSQANADNADYIGIDDVSVTAVPEPATYGLMALGLGLLALRRRHNTAV